MRQKNWMEQREVALKQKVNSGERSATGTINLLRSFFLYGWLYQTTRLVEIKADMHYSPVISDYRHVSCQFLM